MILPFLWLFWPVKENFYILSLGSQTELRTSVILSWNQFLDTLKIIFLVQLENWLKQSSHFRMNSCFRRLSLVSSFWLLSLNQYFWRLHQPKWQREIFKVWKEFTKKFANTFQKWLNHKCLTKSSKWQKDSLEKFTKRKLRSKKQSNTCLNSKTPKNHKTRNYSLAWSLSCILNWDSTQVTQKLSLWSLLTCLLASSMKTWFKRNFSKFCCRSWRTTSKKTTRSTFSPKWSSIKSDLNCQKSLNSVKNFLTIIISSKKIHNWQTPWLDQSTRQSTWACKKTKNSKKPSSSKTALLHNLR